VEIIKKREESEQEKRLIQQGKGKNEKRAGGRNEETRIIGSEET